MSRSDISQSLTAMDYWRLADELSVVDAAILCTGNDPSRKEEVYESGLCLGMRQCTYYDGFDAVFKALRAAIMGNRLRADIRFPMRKAEYEVRHLADYDIKIPNGPGEGDEVGSYDYLIARNDEGKQIPGKTLANFSIDELRTCPDLFIWREPDWSVTHIAVDDLKEWLAARGVYPAFFFPGGNQEGFRNKKHPRYAPKLAACVAAWEEVSVPAKNSTVKQTLKDWLRSNAASYGMGDDNGIVSDTAAEELARIINWAPNGGAAPTSSNMEPAPQRLSGPIQNYGSGYAFEKNSADDDLEDIPF